jgi:L-rhamnonate dehydratase
MTTPFRIRDLRVHTVAKSTKGGDYFNQGAGEHWLVDSLIANPMSGHPAYAARRSSWGIGVLGSIVVEIEAEDGTVGVATGTGGVPAAWLIQNHFRRFVAGQDARNLNLIWDQMYRASLPYGRKGITVMAISAVDLALWDLLGKIRGEPVYHMIGGRAQDEIAFYCTGPDAGAIKGMGFWGAKVPLPHGPADREDGLARNVAFLAAHRAAVGPGYPLMVDCYMSLTVPYAIRLAEACRHLDIHWWEEVLSPEDVEGYRHIRASHPTLRWTTGEHEYTRYGFRPLIEGRLIDVLQPDVMWVGGLTELMRIAAHAGTLDIPVVPHGSGPYSSHFIASQTAPPLCEYVATSADGRSILPVFGTLFDGEDVPQNGRLRLSDAPGFGMVLADRSVLQPLPA